MQDQLDQECIDMLPLVKEALKNLSHEAAYNMRNLALIECVNSQKPLVEMTKEELEGFQRCLLKMFKYHGWYHGHTK